MTTKILLVDVCDTLYPVNTTVDFINYILNKKGAKPSWIHKNKIVKISNAILYKVFDIDLVRVALVRQLKGMTKVELNSLAREYIEQLPLNNEIDSFIKSYVNQGYEVQFHSASLEPIVSAVNDKFNGSGFSSTTLQFDRFEVFNGRILFDNLGRKKEVIKEVAQQYHEVVFVTDNKSDSDCIELCDDFFAVIPKGKPSDFWKTKGVKIVRL
ncbi:hypothetical protein I7100_000956 [Vibrio parahaemolyticus]|uniref:hypothetical protein n=1 Tax=Vibrio parahaemolyticus TaxID=670 RepID=UPI001121D245|nr:hypothetical protein [Vibrio parahaemolyticus]EGQ8123719.1 hypothetical protein [Vibrio parahaemolyticus]EJB8445091.1 hypothetical protein [Vibrio parahaemolyticus]EKL9959952.1 hypothetical protein [Vibrio parahaemolyticus]ELB2006162.1 hypothetical protein [Vibrio parahaemolyticus]TOJ99421.1 hypothetical protein CGI27_14180 [Vibrio parahaemolyticus]